MPKPVPYSFRFDPDLRQRAERRAADEGRTLANLIERALVKYLDDISSEDIMGMNIPTGIPLIYELDDDARAVNNYYIADESELNKAVNEVANQTGSG